MPSASPLTFTFRARIVRLPWGKRFFGLALPARVEAAWRRAGVKRVEGTLGGLPLRRAVQYHSDGAPYLLVGRAVLRRLALREGDTASAVFAPDRQPDEVDVPEALRLTLDLDADVRASWLQLTPGQQRTLAYHVSSAAREETQIRRAAQVAQWVQSGDLPWRRRRDGR